MRTSTLYRMPANRISWSKLWKHRWVVLLFLSQIRHGDLRECAEMVSHYGGSFNFAKALYLACQEIVDAGQ